MKSEQIMKFLLLVAIIIVVAISFKYYNESKNRKITKLEKEYKEKKEYAEMLYERLIFKEGEVYRKNRKLEKEIELIRSENEELNKKIELNNKQHEKNRIVFRNDPDSAASSVLSIIYSAKKEFPDNNN